MKFCGGADGTRSVDGASGARLYVEKTCMGATEDLFAHLASAQGLNLDRKATFQWLTNRGHLEPRLEGHVPEDVLASLSEIYGALGGDEETLGSKRRQLLRPDFVLAKEELLIEVDELQHFTSDRLTALELYPEQVPLGFDLDEYRRLGATWSARADSYRATKQAAGFARHGGRRAQRAYFDSVRDLLTPYFTQRVLRVPAPEGDGELAFERFEAFWDSRA